LKSEIVNKSDIELSPVVSCSIYTAS